MTPTLMHGTVAYIIAGQTLTSGRQIIQGGVTLTIAPGGGSILIEGSEATATPNIAGAIMSVLGMTTNASSGSATGTGSTAATSLVIQTADAAVASVQLPLLLGSLLLFAWVA